MFNKVISKVKEKKRQIFSSSIGMSLMYFGMTPHAEGGTVSADVTGALTKVAGDITATLAAVAPIGLAIAGTFLVWRYGMKFFKSLSK